jgi:uncharacterized membrane protein YbhN (UPF0104 family)
MKARLKSILAIAILVLTVSFFVYYVIKNPQVIDQLKNLPPGTMLLILFLYILSFLAYAVVTRGSLHMFGKTLSVQENLLFNAYSSLINFFGPGQSGPAFRGVYLKKRHNLSVKSYVFATLLYFAFFAVFSVMLMFAGSRPWWQTAILMLAAAVFSGLVIRWYKKRSKLGDKPNLTLVSIGWIGLATAAQVGLQVLIYAVELHSVQANASWGQVMAYTGVANLSLFVSITPGGIGIRESFLLFSQNLHHISRSDIVAASLVDRAVYLILLGLMFIMVISMHAKKKLHITKAETEA